MKQQIPNTKAKISRIEMKNPSIIIFGDFDYSLSAIDIIYRWTINNKAGNFSNTKQTR